MEIYERIRHLRKDKLKMSQEKLGAALGVNRDVIKNIELNLLARPEQKEPLYKLICKTFNVSYEWLTTGEGEMYVESQQAYFDNLAEQYGIGYYGKKILDLYGSLDDGKKVILEQFLKGVAQSFVEDNVDTAANGKDESPSVVEKTIEKMDKMYRAAHSETGTEHEVVPDSQDLIRKLKDNKHLRVKSKDDF